MSSINRVLTLLSYMLDRNLAEFQGPLSLRPPPGQHRRRPLEPPCGAAGLPTLPVIRPARMQVGHARSPLQVLDNGLLEMKLMRGGDLDYFKKFYRMTPQEYDYVLKLVEDDLRRSYVCREPISASERLAMTLRYLSSGDPVKDVALAFRVGISTARAAIVDTCKSLWERLRPIYMPVSAYSLLWQFPNCVGAVDGKHVQMQAPVRSGSLYFNYKKTHSIVLMASADAHYCFTIVDGGAYGRNSDGGVLKNSNFGIAMEKGLLKVPGLKLLPGSDVVAPHVFIGDEAFQL
ncbi:hypothetical protein HPB47_011565 [Ixodes persulcatus]|uniref:Uncharacterized protein n=1 Tax=Ixodes persulcatus TaxID=34615 RepID=A0AC60NVX2_IXOPE|nr:hypothetical protein HPB47_011565 [Ixodes persulcatus]